MYKKIERIYKIEYNLKIIIKNNINNIGNYNQLINKCIGKI